MALAIAMASTVHRHEYDDMTIIFFWCECMLVYEVGYAVREGGVTLSSCCARWVVVGVGLRKVKLVAPGAPMILRHLTWCYLTKF